jgi:Gram-negative porin
MVLLESLEAVGGIWLAISSIAFMFAGASWLTIMSLCLIGALIVLPKSARAADSGANCCDDIEERVAELEATTVRKGNKRVSVQLYGKVNRAVLFWDDGAETNTYVVDNHYESSRFGLIGSAKIAGEWSAGYRLEIENRIAASTQLNQFNDDNATAASLAVRWSTMYLNNTKWGELRWGLTATPKYDITKDTNVFAPNLIDTTSSDNRMNQNFRLRPKGFNNAEGLSSLTWSNISRCYSSSEAFNCSTRRNGATYWSPKWHGFSASAGWFEDDDWGAALRYKDEWGENFLVGAGIGYENFRDERLQNGGGGAASGPNPPFAAPKNTTFFQRNFDEWAGMANIKHKRTGLFAFTALSFSDSSDTNARGIYTKKGPPDMSGWDVQLGIQRKMPWFGLDRLGDTAFWGGYSNIHDGIAQGSNGNGGNLGGIPANGFLPASTFASVPVDTQITGSDVDRWFLAADQWIDSAAIQLYAVYQHLSADISLVDQDLKRVPASLDDFDVVYTGAIIYF